MGTTCMPKPANVKEFLADMYTWENENTTHRHKCLDVKIKGMRTAYLAVEHTDKETGERSVTAEVVLLSYYPRDAYNFCYKEVSEEMGPFQCECPKSILELLTPTKNEYANEWREKCWANVNKPKATIGSTIKLISEIGFTNGLREDTFKVIRYGKRGKRYLSQTYGFSCTISGLNRIGFTVLEA